MDPSLMTSLCFPLKRMDRLPARLLLWEDPVLQLAPAARARGTRHGAGPATLKADCLLRLEAASWRSQPAIPALPEPQQKDHTHQTDPKVP